MNKLFFITAPALVISAVSLLCAPAHADGKGFKAGAEFREDASLGEIGVPTYPGAVAQLDKEQDKAALTLGLWGGAFGFKLQVRKFTSSDDIESVAGFYVKALSQYGKLLDCAKAPPRAKREGKSEDKTLYCSDEERQPGKRVYKVGADSMNFRLVSLQQVGNAVNFQMVRVQMKVD